MLDAQARIFVLTTIVPRETIVGARQRSHSKPGKLTTGSAAFATLDIRDMIAVDVIVQRGMIH